MLFSALLFAPLALALPSRIQKRSFQAPVRGRSPQGPLDDVIHVHRKYDWPIVSAESAPAALTTASPERSASLPTPASNKYAQTIFTTLTTAPATQSSNIPDSYRPYPNSTASAAPSAAAGSEDGEVVATPEDHEIEYLSPVRIGGQLLNLNFDTGSSDLWIFSTKLPVNRQGNHSLYDASLSSTYAEFRNASWSIQYGDGSAASGVVGFDTVDVGGSTVAKQCIELATQVSTQFTQDEASDGLLGLGFGNINKVLPTPQKTFFENVMDSLSEPLFTVDLEDNMGTGTYEFGIIDTSKFTGDVHYVDVDSSDGWWQFSLPSVRIGTNDTLTCNGTCTPAIADTGTSLVYLDSAVVTAYYDQVPGSELYELGTYIYPCNATLPDLSLSIGGHYATIKGEDVTYLAFGGETPGPSGKCMGGLQAGPADLQILGDVFLKQVFTVFDGGNLRFGVAEKN